MKLIKLHKLYTMGNSHKGFIRKNLGRYGMGMIFNTTFNNVSDIVLVSFTGGKSE